MDPILSIQDEINRRTFMKQAGGMGLAALLTMLGGDALASPGQKQRVGGLTGLPHFTPKAKRVIYLFQSGAPSQLELFDYKPHLKDLRATELPESIRQGQ